MVKSAEISWIREWGYFIAITTENKNDKIFMSQDGSIHPYIWSKNPGHEKQCFNTPRYAIQTFKRYYPNKKISTITSHNQKTNYTK